MGSGRGAANTDRLVTAYQEDLLTLDELRRRMPDLRQRENSLHAELQSIIDQVNDRTAYLRLAESLSAFLGRLRASAETLDVHERQRIVRLLVKDVLVGDDTITIRHSITIPSGPRNDGDPPTPRGGAQAPPDESYLLRSGCLLGENDERDHRHDSDIHDAEREQDDEQQPSAERVCWLAEFCVSGVVPLKLPFWASFS